MCSLAQTSARPQTILVTILSWVTLHIYSWKPVGGHAGDLELGNTRELLGSREDYGVSLFLEHTACVCASVQAFDEQKMWSELIFLSMKP